MREMGGLKKDGRHRAFTQRTINITRNLALSGVYILEGVAGWTKTDEHSTHYTE